MEVMNYILFSGERNVAQVERFGYVRAWFKFLENKYKRLEEKIWDGFKFWRFILWFFWRIYATHSWSCWSFRTFRPPSQESSSIWESRAQCPRTCTDLFARGYCSLWLAGEFSRCRCKFHHRSSLPRSKILANISKKLIAFWLKKRRNFTLLRHQWSWTCSEKLRIISSKSRVSVTLQFKLCE